MPDRDAVIAFLMNARRRRDRVRWHAFALVAGTDDVAVGYVYGVAGVATPQPLPAHRLVRLVEDGGALAVQMEGDVADALSQRTLFVNDVAYALADDPVYDPEQDRTDALYAVDTPPVFEDGKVYTVDFRS